MQGQLLVGRPRLRAPQAVFLISQCYFLCSDGPVRELLFEFYVTSTKSVLLLNRQDETKSIYQRESGKTRSQKKQRNVLDSVYGNEELTLTKPRKAHVNGI